MKPYRLDIFRSFRGHKDRRSMDRRSMDVFIVFELVKCIKLLDVVESINVSCEHRNSVVFGCFLLGRQ